MSVVIETTLGDFTVDLFLSERPTACMNFLKLCKLKYYNYNLFHTISRGFIAQTGDPTGSRTGGESIFGILKGFEQRYFQGENKPRIKHTKMGLISFVGNEDFMLGSQFFITLGEDLTYLDEKHCVFGEVVEGFDILEIINEVICDGDDRPYQDVRITHIVILDDPFPDPKALRVPSRSPSPSVERLMGGRIAPDEEIDEMEGKNAAEIAELQADREAKARATILEMVGDIPDAEMAPPENVLFVCKLNPVTTDDDLEIIFNRFGKIKSCEVIRDRKTGDSLQYGFIEFEDRKACEDAYFKMDNILIDDRRIHVDFSQSVSKIKWHGKGRGVTHYDEKGKIIENNNGKERKKSYNNSSKKYESKEVREKNSDRVNTERISHKYGRYDNINKEYKSHHKKEDSYRGSKNKPEYKNNNNSSKNRSEYSKRLSERDYKSPIRGSYRYKSGERIRNNDVSSKKNQEYVPRSYEKHYSGDNSKKKREKSPENESKRSKVRRRYSSESSEDCMDRNSNKKYSSNNKDRKTDRNNSAKYGSKSKGSTTSKKKKYRNDSSSETSDDELSRKKKIPTKYSQKSESSSDSNSEDNKKYKQRKNKKKHRSDSDGSTRSESSEYDKKKYKNKKEVKKKTRKRKSSDSSGSQVDRKRKRR